MIYQIISFILDRRARFPTWTDAEIHQSLVNADRWYWNDIDEAWRIYREFVR